jgi:hypothetical protein
MRKRSKTIRQNPCWVVDVDKYQSIYRSFHPIYTQALTAIISFFNPEPITQHLAPDNRVTIGVVCVNDAYDYLKEAWWLLHNAFCFHAYIENCRENEYIFIPRIYTDDTCLRLYSSAEHLASAIVAILGIDRKNFKSDKQKALAVRLGKYFLAEHPNHKLSAPIKKLISSEQWKTVILWRNNWVHNKRIISTERPEYKRHNLWTRKDKTTFEISMGPKRQTASDYHLAEILQTILTALNTYIVCFHEIIAFLKEFICDEIFKGRLLYTLKKTGKNDQIPSFKYRESPDVTHDKKQI